MDSAIPSTHFSTTGLPAIDQFDAWHDKIAVIFDVARLGGPHATSFHADVRAYQIGNIVVTDSRQDEQAYSLTPRRTRATHTDLFQIGLYRSGGYRGDANGRVIEGKPGDVQVLDLARPMRSVEAASDMVCVFVPRELLQERIGDLDDLHGVDLRSSMGRLLADYLRLLAERLPQMPERDGEAASIATIEIIAACLRPHAKLLRDAETPIQDVILHRAKTLIEARLQTSHLMPDSLCRTLGMSRRSLYRAFEPLGGVHHYIQKRRLAAIFRSLIDPNDHRRISDIAALYGYSCQETFWRAFKRQYGVTPGDMRAGAAPSSKLKAFDPGDRFDDWIRRLHV